MTEIIEDILNSEEIKKLNPIDVMKMFGMPMLNFIAVNPCLTKDNGAQYEIIRQCTHDGTLLFTKKLLWETLKNIVHKASFFKGDEPPDDEMQFVKYEVGMITLTTEECLNPVNHVCKGEIQTTKMPVKCIRR